MKKKTCSQCRKIKNLSFYNFRNKKLNILNSACKVCTRKQGQLAYQKNVAHYKQKAKENNRKRHIKTMRFVYKYLQSHPCVDCGEQDPIILQFDHVRGKKIKAVSLMIRERYSIQKIACEISKCQVRCANCHMKRTAKISKFYKHVYSQHYSE